MNLVFSVFAILLLAPLLGLIAFLIWCDDGRPIFYKQLRIGKGWRQFTLYKFRTMVNGADRNGFLTSREDTRITRLGSFLRRWKLDEFPQFLNVLKGDMQLVGYRPEVREYVEQFQDEYRELISDLPGITDPASLAYHNEEKLLYGADLGQQYVNEVLPRKLALSIHYQRTRTLRMDASLALNTVLCILGRAMPQGCTRGPIANGRANNVRS